MAGKPRADESVSFIQRLRQGLQNRTFHAGIGLFLLFSGLFIGGALISFYFNWKEDQSLIQGGFFDLLFNPDYQVKNVLGKVGAALGHQLIFRWFGLPAFLIPYILIVSGVRVAFRFRIHHLPRFIRRSLFQLFWWSTALAFLTGARQSGIWSGAGGYFFNLYLNTVLGPLGTGLLLAFLQLTFLTFAFKWTPESLHNFMLRFKPRAREVLDEPEEDDSPDEQAVAEEPLEIELNEPEEPEISMAQQEPAGEPEIELPLSPPSSVQPPPAREEDEVDMEIEEAGEEDTLDEREVERKLKEFGEYDPKLDLSRFRLPGLDLLADHGSSNITINQEELELNKNRIVETLKQYNIEIAKIKATIGPTVTLYEIVPAPGVRISRIKNLEDDIALSLAALGIRIIAPIPGKGTIGIEVPNANPNIVGMKNILSSEKFQNAQMDLPVALGKTISNETFVADLAKMPHLLMAGATGQGKSVGLNVILASILYKKHPSQVKFVLVDPKKVELTLFNKIERHYLAKLPGTAESIITDTKKVIYTLNSLCIEMDDRYDLLKNAMVRNIKEYNAKFVKRRLNPEEGHRYLPYIVLVIDEFADLIMTAGKEVETPIARLAQLARAIGIHLIIATQRPSVNVITGIIKANFPSRIAFRVTSKIDSRTILDAGGADQLIGKGDMLYSSGNDLIRVQCAFLDTPEVEKVCEFIGSQQGYPEAYLLPEYEGEESGGLSDMDPSERDSMFTEAARVVVMHQQGSASLLQRKLKLGYNRAGRIIDQLEAAGIIGPFEGSKARQVLVRDETQLEQLLNRDA